MSAPFTLHLHPDAARNFDERAERLLPLVSPVRVPGQQEGGFKPDIHPSAKLTEKDIIGEIQVGFVDYRGRECARTFEHGGKMLGLFDQGFNDLETLATRLQQTSEIRPYVSVRCLIGSGFEWVKKRYRGETDESFTSFVVRECAQQIKESEIWLPLFNVYIQAELTIGRITFRTVTREMLDRYFERILKNLPQEQQAALQEPLSRRRSRFQGCAAATIALTAEPLRAQEVASQEAEYSTAALRFFHGANLSPYLRCYCTIRGMETFSSISTLLVRGRTIETWADRSADPGGSIWILPEDVIREFQDAGLNALSQLLAKDNRSAFERDLLDAILIYSRNSLFDDPANRLIYILAAVESILLRDNNEPIQKNIAERLAFVVGATTDERIVIRNNVTRVYALRSAFLHHGRALAEMEALEVFMQHVWRGFVMLICDMNNFRTKEDLIAALERRKME
jgi:hypothetical protein